MSNILDDTHNLLRSNRKKVDSILMKTKIASKAVELNIPKPKLTTSVDNNARSASFDNHNNNNNDVPYFVVATDLAGFRSKYAGSNLEKERLKSGSKSDPSAYLTIRTFRETGGYESKEEDESIKNASHKKPDPTAFITTRNHLSDKINSGYMSVSKLPPLITNASENNNVKGASSGRKPAYLVTRDHMFKGSTD